MAPEMASVGSGTFALLLNDRKVTSQRMRSEAHSKRLPQAHSVCLRVACYNCEESVRDLSAGATMLLTRRRVLYGLEELKKIALGIRRSKGSGAKSR